jgi:hypothetical protein
LRHLPEWMFRARFAEKAFGDHCEEFSGAGGASEQSTSIRKGAQGK